MRVTISRETSLEVVRLVEAKSDAKRRQSNSPTIALEAQAAMAQYDAIIATFGYDFSIFAFDDLHDVSCKLVANSGVGINHIDIAATRRAGIRVTNTPGAITEATADIALTLMLMTCRRAGEGERMVRAGNWRGWGPTQLLGMHMSGKTIGIIGMGRIG